MKNSLPPSLWGVLSNPMYALVAFGIAFLFFDLEYLAMAHLPGYENEMCVMGAGLNPLNISFAIVQSLLIGIFIVGFYATLKRSNPSLTVLSLSGVGALVGGMTVFCTLCTIPIISLFGFSIGLGFFTTYDLWFKALSLVLLAVGLFELNRQLKGECKRCFD